VKRPRIPRAPSRWEELFKQHVAVMGLPEPLREYRFTAARRWRFDFAWPAVMVAAEIEGLARRDAGGLVMGRHLRPAGFAADVEKYNTAAIDGWLVLRFTPAMVQEGAAVRVLRAALAKRAA
jgi:hypothetical protein